jgi:hypothetical protein
MTNKREAHQRLEPLMRSIADARQGDSNDQEIEAYRYALEEALRVLGLQDLIDTLYSYEG